MAVDRLFFGPGGLLISMPGIPVLGASAGDLMFTSDASSCTLWMRGATTVANNQVLAVPFGRTFAGTPLVCAEYTPTNQPGSWRMVNYYGIYNNVNIAECTLAIGPSDMGITTGVNAGIYVRYTIWDFVIG